MLKKMLGAACLFAMASAHAYTDDKPLTFSVAADSDYPFCCTVVTGPVQVNAAFNDYFSRGMAEFNLLGPRNYIGEKVFLSFNYLGSYASGFNTFSAPISISAYIGDNMAALPDYGVASFASVGSFTTVGRAVGDQITFDVTSIFQYATRAGAPALGFRLATSGTSFRNVEGANFNTFALTPAVPEPSEYALMLAGLGAMGMAVRRKRARQAS